MLKQWLHDLTMIIRTILNESNLKLINLFFFFILLKKLFYMINMYTFS